MSELSLFLLDRFLIVAARLLPFGGDYAAIEPSATKVFDLALPGDGFELRTTGVLTLVLLSRATLLLTNPTELFILPTLLDEPESINELSRFILLSLCIFLVV